MVEENIEKYEMRIPPGITGQIVAHVMEEFDLEVKQSDFGPVFLGEMKNLEDARDYIVKELNARISELENKNGD